MAAFFLDFPETHLAAAVDLSSGIRGLAVSLVAFTMGFTSASVIGGGEGLGCGLVGLVVVALMTRRLERRDSTPRPGPSARQRDWPAEL